MFEPIRVIPHPSDPLHGKQAIIDCGNGYGLSVIWSSQDRWDSGFYMSGTGKDAEVMLITFTSEDCDYELFRLGDWLVEPKGWLTWEEIGALAERISKEGWQAYESV